MKKGIVQIAVVAQRFEPSHQSEMVNQLLFGDTVKIIDKNNNWYWVLNEFDDSEGWVEASQLAITNAYIPLSVEGFLTGFSAFNTLISSDGSLNYIPPACTLPGFLDGFCDLGNQQFEVDCEVIKPAEIGREELIQNALFFLNVPFLWGGKTHLGIDAAGFTQIVLKSLGVRLKRKPYLQVEQGELVSFLQEALPGDLAFFDNDEGEIIHVGILIDPTKIIHVSGKVRIDFIDNQGVIHSGSLKRTYNLRVIKRFTSHL